MHVTGNEDGSECVTSVLFDRLWAALCDALGCAAAAALLRRSHRRASKRCPALAGVVIERAGSTYRCSVPESWKSVSPDAVRAFRIWLEELIPFLVELTGAVVVRRLATIPEFQRWRVMPAAFAPTKDTE